MIPRKFREFQENLCALIQLNTQCRESITKIYKEIDSLEKTNGVGAVYIVASLFKEVFYSKFEDFDQMLIAQDIANYMDLKSDPNDLDTFAIKLTHCLPKELESFRKLIHDMFEDQRKLENSSDNLRAKLNSYTPEEQKYLHQYYDFCINFVTLRTSEDNISFAKEILDFWKESLVLIDKEPGFLDCEKLDSLVLQGDNPEELCLSGELLAADSAE